LDEAPFVSGAPHLDYDVTNFESGENIDDR